MATIVKNLFLALSLLIAQTVLAVHQVDVDQHIDGHACEVCLVGQGPGNALPGTELVFAINFTEQNHIISNTNVFVSFYHSPLRARGPPTHF